MSNWSFDPPKEEGQYYLAQKYDDEAIDDAPVYEVTVKSLGGRLYYQHNGTASWARVKKLPNTAWLPNKSRYER